jgi:hypothetical protein
MTIVIPEIYHDSPVTSRPRLQRTPSDSAEFLILAVRGPLRRKGPFRGMARVNRLVASAPISLMGEPG